MNERPMRVVQRIVELRHNGRRHTSCTRQGSRRTPDVPLAYFLREKTMKVGKALIAGLVGGAAMTTLAWFVRRMGIDMNAEMMLGTMVSSPGTAAWLIGFAMHMMLSAVIALIYALGFERVTHRAGAVVGLGFAVIHVILAGMVMGMIPAIHPMIPEQMPAPGAFMANMGTTFLALFVIEHLMFGTIVGAMYGPVVSARPLRTETANM